jgi:hypothetical protein|tara:strand:+ start:530 stop:670 length:141 start_codon:yes stop_codon:yes gene_type:complete
MKWRTRGKKQVEVIIEIAEVAGSHGDATGDTSQGIYVRRANMTEQV